MAGGRRAALALLALAAALAAVVAVQLRDGVPDGTPQGGPVPASSQGRSTAQPAAPGDAALPPMDRSGWAAAALARPLFSRSRRPPSVAEAGPAAAAGLPRLAGVVVNGTDRSAILVPADGGRPVVAREGAQVGGVTIQTIQAGRVTVLGPGGTRVLRPTADPNRPVGAATQSAPAPVPGSFPLFNGLPPPPLPGSPR